MLTNLGFRGFRRVLAQANPHHRIPSTYQVQQTLNLFRTRQSFSSLAAPAVISLNEFWSELWGSILRAVPKQKTSHSKKRSRQLAGKALKDVKSLNQCSGCGRVKRMHFLCPYCVQNIKDIWAGRWSGSQNKKKTDKPN